MEKFSIALLLLVLAGIGSAPDFAPLAHNICVAEIAPSPVAPLIKVFQWITDTLQQDFGWFGFQVA